MNKKYTLEFVTNIATIAASAFKDSSDTIIRKSLVNNLKYDDERLNQSYKKYELDSITNQRDDTNGLDVNALDEEIVKRAREFCKENEEDAVNVYVSSNDVLLYSYLIVFRNHNYPEVNFDYPQIIRSDSIEFQKMYYIDSQAYHEGYAALEFNTVNNSYIDGQIYKITNIEHIDKLKESVRTDRTIAIVSAIVIGLSYLLYNKVIYQIKTNDLDTIFKLIGYVIMNFGDCAIFLIGVAAFIASTFEYLFKSKPRLDYVKTYELRKGTVRKAIRKQKKKLRLINYPSENL